MNEQEKHSQPKIYERIDPGSRFSMIADDILKTADTEQDDDYVSTAWSDSEGKDEYCLVRYRQEGSPNTIYQLTHNDRRHSNDSWTRYMVMATGENISDVMFINDGKPVVPLDIGLRDTMSRSALEILAAKNPESAQTAKETAIAKAFPRVVANFILSDFADEENGQVFNRATTRKAVIGHQAWVKMVQNDEVANAEEQPSCEEFPQPAHAEKVRKAASTLPSKHGRGQFLAIPMKKTAVKLAGDMGYEWEHTVNRDTDRYDKIMEERGDHG